MATASASAASAPSTFAPGQQDLEHRLDLRLFRPAGADDRLLDQPRGMFGHR